MGFLFKSGKRTQTKNRLVLKLETSYFTWDLDSNKSFIMKTKKRKANKIFTLNF